jgi:hypothetical protein
MHSVVFALKIRGRTYRLSTYAFIVFTSCKECIQLNVAAERLASCFVFRRSQVRLSAWGLAILTKVFRGFSQSLQADVGIVVYLKSDHDRFLPYTFQFIID